MVAATRCWAQCMGWCRGNRYGRQNDVDDPQTQPSFPSHDPPRQQTIGRAYNEHGQNDAETNSRPLGGEEPPEGFDARSTAAARAEARQKEYTHRGIGDATKSNKLAQQKQKDEWLGKLKALYEQLGEEVPFHLGALSVEQLKDHYEKHKKETMDLQEVLMLERKSQLVAGRKQQNQA
eukprot:GEMP01073557.1.p1 GENE.GEMP01073557.1~~GEMP01073557.1.p1  ORF type:complete len:178 (+),score=38.48 GEMP01073557.1:179-712(+)